VQAVRDRRRGAPAMTQAQMQRRVDEFHDYGKQHTQRVVASASREAKRRGMTKEQATEHVSGARGGAKDQVRRMFVQEFGTATHVGNTHHPEAPKPGTPEFADVISRQNKVAALVNRPGSAGEGRAAQEAFNRTLRRRNLEYDPRGRIRPQQVKAIVTPRNAKQGHLFESRADAETIAERLNKEAATLRRGAHGPHQALGRNVQVPHEFKVVDAGHGQFGVVPKAAAERLAKHQVVGSSQAPGAKYMRIAGRSFRGAVLPLSMRWLVGQVGEAGFRAAVAGAGPADLYRLNRIVKEMNKAEKGAGDRFLARIHGGQFDLTGTAREFAADERTLADELHGTAIEDVGRAVTRVGQAKPLKAIRNGWNRYTNVVFNVVNGTIETTARKAMAGQAIRRGALMDKRLIGLSDKAIREAAQGLRGTDAQIQTARAVDRMYGQYQKFSPEKREHLLHTTPFYPWYRNMAGFLFQTLPVDHPLKAALVADLNAATEDWRKAHGLSLRQGGHKPGFLQGTYPVGSEGQTIPVGRYLPFAPGEPLQAAADLFLPQYANFQDTLRGRDWKGKELKGKDIPKELARSVVEAHVPGAGQVERIATAEDRKAAALREINPFPRTRKKQASGGPLQMPALELTPLQLQQLQIR
ncbi:MAG TPA: hypothetical protein VE650_06175, partial [Acetobacteraceae bacterium]|nr:hypothetical protein [Acetobacteraceae bacterium]